MSCDDEWSYWPELNSGCCRRVDVPFCNDPNVVHIIYNDPSGILTLHSITLSYS
jgi:hypothetical protein